MNTISPPQLSSIGFQGSSLLVSVMSVLYDHALTLDDEVNEIWAFPSSPAGILVLLVRYFGLCSRLFSLFVFFDTKWTPALFINAKSQIFWYNYGDYHYSFTYLTVVMVIRVVALYRGRTLILVFLAILLIGEIALMPIPIYIEIGTLGPPIQGCLTGQSPINKRVSLGIYWTIPLFVDTIILILTLNKSRQYAKQMNTAAPVCTGRNLILRDIGHNTWPEFDAFARAYAPHAALTSRLIMNEFKASPPGVKNRGSYLHAAISNGARLQTRVQSSKASKRARSPQPSQ
ncbi:hypothetical protein K439DRAFT_1614683 [Ramaria rubella]|nr:hypothetical protein K439DRAFT_1614683 [Ramaria rubella]